VNIYSPISIHINFLIIARLKSKQLVSSQNFKSRQYISVFIVTQNFSDCLFKAPALRDLTMECNGNRLNRRRIRRTIKRKSPRLGRRDNRSPIQLLTSFAPLIIRPRLSDASTWRFPPGCVRQDKCGRSGKVH
jgi:hypothetical protein